MDSRSELLHDMQHTSGKTLEAVRLLRQRARAWLDEHPADEQVLGCGEGLKMQEGALLMEGDKPTMD